MSRGSAEGSSGALMGSGMVRMMRTMTMQAPMATRNGSHTFTLMVTASIGGVMLC